MWTRVQWGAGKRADYGNLLCAWCFLPSSPSVLQGRVSLTCDQLPERGGLAAAAGILPAVSLAVLEPGGRRWHSWTASRVEKTLFPG